MRPLVLLQSAVDVNPAMLRDALAALEAKLFACATTSATSAVSTPGRASSDGPTTAPAGASTPVPASATAAEATPMKPDAAKADLAAARDTNRLELARAILKRRKAGSKAWSAAIDARAVALLRSI